MRTLVVSDLHLGARLRHDVLAQPQPLERLLGAIDTVDRLVLLGDTVELLEGRGRQAMAVAEPVLRALGAQLGSEREVILVPGNHDIALVRNWVRAHPGELEVETPVPLDATPALARVSSVLAPARVSVRYPGAWLGGGVWATHGHYLDRHLLPESAFGIRRTRVRRAAQERATPTDYEHPRGPSLTRVEAVLTSKMPRPLAALVEDAAELARAATMPRAARRLLRVGLAPVTSSLLGMQVRRAGIPALLRVAQRLGVAADWIVFGHVHRLGPLPADRPLQWQGAGGWPRVLNSGSWVYEPLLVHRATAPHPYWPGGAVMLEDGREPRPLGLLDDLSPAAFH